MEKPKKPTIKGHKFDHKRGRLIIFYTNGTKTTWTGTHALEMLDKINKETQKK